MPSLAGSESSLVIRAGWSGDESLSFAFPLLQDQPDAMQVGRQHRQGNRTREAVRTMAANSVESPMLQPIDGRLDRRMRIRMPALSDESALSLMSRIAGRHVSLGEMYGWPESMRNAAKRPLFAVMIGSELRRRPELHLTRPVQLIDRLAQQVVENSRHEGEKIDTLLQELAVQVISTGQRVPKRHLNAVHSDHRRLADSLVIDEHDDTLDFTLQILRDWYAARAVIEGTIDTRDPPGI